MLSSFDRWSRGITWLSYGDGVVGVPCVRVVAIDDGRVALATVHRYAFRPQRWVSVDQVTWIDGPSLHALLHRLFDGQNKRWALVQAGWQPSPMSFGDWFEPPPVAHSVCYPVVVENRDEEE